MNQRSGTNRVCWVCGGEDHVKTNCDTLKKDPKYPYKKWFINQAVEEVQSIPGSTTPGGTES